MRSVKEMNKTINKENIISEKEFEKLAQLGESISKGLSCDVNGKGVPCRADRLFVVGEMIEYLNIHNLALYNRETFADGTSIYVKISQSKDFCRRHLNKMKVSK